MFFSCAPQILADTCPANPSTGFLGGECPTPASSAVNTDPDPIAAINAQIAEKQKEIDDIKQQADVYQQEIDQTKGTISSLEGEVNAIDNQIALTNLDIQTKQAQIDSLTLEIRSLQLSIDQKTTDINARKDVLASTIRQLDASTRTTTLELVMKYDNFNEFYSQAQAQAEMSKSLQDAISSIQRSRQELQTKQDELNKAQVDVKQAKTQLEDQKSTSEEQKGYKDDILSQTKKSSAQYQQLLSGSQNEADQVNSIISSLQTSLLSKLSGGQTTIDLPSPSGFIWPVPGRQINATFLDPSYNLGGRRHYGIDIEADQGTPVKATADGLVTGVRGPVVGGAPSVVQIQHGGGFVTYFLHMHQIFVAEGQNIKQGDIIGYSGGQCGTAGAGTCGVYTTGAHLHYEMHNCQIEKALSNCAVNPLNYLP